MEQGTIDAGNDEQHFAFPFGYSHQVVCIIKLDAWPNKPSTQCVIEPDIFIVVDIKHWESLSVAIKPDETRLLDDGGPVVQSVGRILISRDHCVERMIVF